ncbi:MAG: Maf family protein, partial [Bacilli bacterium]|nr:Maf family protein [Bacilli bacterium]
MIILASNSPRRKELMEKYVTSSFLIEPSDIDESIYQDIDPIKTVEQTAKAKGEYIFQKNHDDIIISADTIVVIDNQILGKPKNRNDAIKMLMMMKGKRHEVIT